MDYAVKVEEFIKCADDIQKEYSANYELVGIKDEETQDLLHQIELGAYADRGKAATALSKVRKQRRDAKNYVESYKQVIDFLDKNKYIVEKSKELLGMLRKAAKPRIRIYHPRVRDDLKIGEVCNDNARNRTSA